MTDPENERSESAAQTETVNMAKANVESGQLATAVWADALSLTSKKLDEMDADAFDIKINITVREATDVTDTELHRELSGKNEGGSDGE